LHTITPVAAATLLLESYPQPCIAMWIKITLSQCIHNRAAIGLLAELFAIPPRLILNVITSGHPM